MDRAIAPPMAPLPFSTPVYQTCRREAGTVLTPPPPVQEGTAARPAQQLIPRLERRASMTADIVVVEPVVNDSTSHEATATTAKKKTAFLLQRKIRESTFGSVRIGFLLRNAMQEGGENIWEVVPSEGLYPYEMVAIKMESLSRIHRAQEERQQGPGNVVRPETEQAALLMIGAADPLGQGHVLAPATVAIDPLFSYTITPYHLEGSLHDLCAAQGRLSENDARFFFRQILEGLTSLQGLGICHGSLASEHVLLTGTKCVLAHFSSALRIPQDTAGAPHLMVGQTPAGTTPVYVAPELFSSQAFDGTAVDLWAAGIILYKMVLTDATLFSTPCEVDPRFRELSVGGNLKAMVKQWQTSTNGSTAGGTTASEGVLDLLQSMLRANPADRLTLAQVKAHPWVVAQGVNVTPPVIPRDFTLDYQMEEDAEQEGT